MVIIEQMKESRFVKNIGLGFKTPREVPGRFLSLHVEMVASCVERASVFEYCLTVNVTPHPLSLPSP